MRLGVATEDVLNLKTNFFALEITMEKSGSLLVNPIWGSLALLILNSSKINDSLFSIFSQFRLHFWGKWFSCTLMPDVQTE
jgi:hypothetical protein